MTLESEAKLEPATATTARTLLEAVVAPAKAKKRPALTKVERIAKEKAALLADLAADRFEDTRSRVAFILNHNVDARNSDVALAIHYWRTFSGDRLSSDAILLENLYRVARFTTLARMRAKIQNDFGLYKADEEVEERRAELAQQHVDQEVEDKPDSAARTVHILCDESGKNDPFLVLGSVWVLDEHRYFQLYLGLNRWKAERGLERELHFARMGKSDVDNYLAFVREALAQSDTLGIKIIVMPRPASVRAVDDIIYRMHAQLVIQGLEHELRTKRIALPRHIALVKDADEGADGLRVPELRQHLIGASKGLFDGAVRIRSVEAKNSRENPLLQLADLVAGAALRVLTRDPAAERKHKDEFADALLGSLGLSPSLESVLGMDFATVVRL